jgi:hypothetical protein
MKNINKLISSFENGSPDASCPPRKPPRVKTLPSYKMPRSDSGLQLESISFQGNESKIVMPGPTDRFSNYKNVSVKKLREIWENVASSNNWTMNGRKVTISDVRSSKSCLTSSKCDMIVCGIKTVIINQVKMHQIELGCHHCDSRFLMTAAHECEKDDDLTNLVVQHGNIFNFDDHRCPAKQFKYNFVAAFIENITTENPTTGLRN